MPIKSLDIALPVYRDVAGELIDIQIQTIERYILAFLRSDAK